MANDQDEPDFRTAIASAREASGSAASRCEFLLRALGQHVTAIGFPAVFWTDTLKTLWDESLGEVGGDDFLASLVEVADEEPGQPLMSPELIALNAAAAYAVQAIKADRAGDPSAWAYAFDASQWEGMLSGLIASQRGPEAAKAAVNQKTWEVREPERNRDMLSALLYKTLREIHAKGEPRPSASKVLAEWLERQPAGFEVTTAGISWFDDNVEKQFVDRALLQGRIKNMVGAKVAKGSLRPE